MRAAHAVRRLLRPEGVHEAARCTRCRRSVRQTATPISYGCLPQLSNIARSPSVARPSRAVHLITVRVTVRLERPAADRGRTAQTRSRGDASVDPRAPDGRLAAMPGAHLPNVLAARYASGPMVDLWSPEHKVVLERQLWVAVLRAQHDLGRRRPARGDRRLRGGDRPGRPRVHRGPRAGHPPRREGADRGVLRPRRPRAHPQGHDLARPDRERRAAAGPRGARARPRPDGHRAGPPGRAGRRARRRS